MKKMASTKPWNTNLDSYPADETIHIDYVDEQKVEICCIKWKTPRLEDWKVAHQTLPCKEKNLKLKVTTPTQSQIKYSQRQCKITINFYKTGVITVQGLDASLKVYLEHIYPKIKQYMPSDEQHMIQDDTNDILVNDDSYMHEATFVKRVATDMTPPRMTDIVDNNHMHEETFVNKVVTDDMTPQRTKDVVDSASDDMIPQKMKDVVDSTIKKKTESLTPKMLITNQINTVNRRIDMMEENYTNIMEQILLVLHETNGIKDSMQKMNEDKEKQKDSEKSEVLKSLKGKESELHKKTEELKNVREELVEAKETMCRMKEDAKQKDDQINQLNGEKQRLTVEKLETTTKEAELQRSKEDLEKTKTELKEVRESLNEAKDEIKKREEQITLLQVQKKDQKEKKDEQEQTVPQKTIWFSGPDDPLSNLYPIKEELYIFEELFSSAEEAYQTMKADFHNDKKSRAKIRRASDAVEIKQIGKHIKTTEEWKNEKDEVMKNIAMEKYKQCKKYREKLMSISLSDNIAEATKHPFWGGKGGQNKMGKIHMTLRKTPPTVTQTESEHQTDSGDESDNDDNPPHYNLPTENRYQTLNQSVQKDPTTQGKPVECLLLTDSIGKYVDSKRLFGRKNAAIRRSNTVKSTIDCLNSWRTNEVIKVVAFHVGSNDIRNGIHPSEIAKQVNEMFQLASNKYPNAKLLYSENLLEGRETHSAGIQDLNKRITNICVLQNHKYISHGRLNSGVNRQEMFQDIIHLNEGKGTAMLVSDLNNAVRGQSPVPRMSNTYQSTQGMNQRPDQQKSGYRYNYDEQRSIPVHYQGANGPDQHQQYWNQSVQPQYISWDQSPIQY